MKKNVLIPLLTTSVLIVGCGSNKESIHPEFGNAVQSNMAVHIVNPRVKSSSAVSPEMSGQRVKRAMEKYQTGDVERLKIESTSSKTGNK